MLLAPEPRMTSAPKVSVLSPNVQGYLGRVDRAKYSAMKAVARCNHTL